MDTPSYLYSVLMTYTNSWFLNEVKTFTSMSTEGMWTDFSHCVMWNKSHEILPWKHHFFLSLCLLSLLPFCTHEKSPSDSHCFMALECGVTMQTTYMCVVLNWQISMGLWMSIRSILYWYVLAIGETQVYACGVTL